MSTSAFGALMPHPRGSRKASKYSNTRPPTTTSSQSPGVTAALPIRTGRARAAAADGAASAAPAAEGSAGSAMVCRLTLQTPAKSRVWMRQAPETETSRSLDFRRGPRHDVVEAEGEAAQLVHQVALRLKIRVRVCPRRRQPHELVGDRPQPRPGGCSDVRRLERVHHRSNAFLAV